MPLSVQPIFLGELVPRELKATIHLHVVDALGGATLCWSYVTEGLTRHDQREFIFTLVRESGEKPESYPREPLEIIEVIYRLAKQGHIVGPGRFTFVTGRGFLGFHGFAYIEPVWQPPASSTPGNWLAAIGLTADELATVQQFGPTRVLSILGKVERCYPAPYWTKRNRPSCLSLEAMRQSFLVKVQRVNSGFMVYRERERIVLRAQTDHAGEAVKALASLSPEMPIAFLTQIDSAADGALVWLPGEAQSQAITPPGSGGERLSGSFVVFLPGQKADKGQLLEDGYALHLTSQSWERLRGAIFAQEEIQADVFELRWTPAGFKAYLPQPGAPAPISGTRVRASKIVLLQSEAEISGAITAEELVGITRSVENVVQTQFSRGSDEGQLMVTVEIQPGGKARYKVATQGVIEQASLQLLWEELQKLVPPAVEKPVVFAVEFDIK